MTSVLESVNAAVWGVPLLSLMLGAGLILSLKTKFIQFRMLPRALAQFWRQFKLNGEADGVSSYRALCMALAATVGTGNLAGVAGALSIGGPGAIFWMWVCALFGMATKFAEATLSVRYRQKSNNNEYVGGPMHIIQNGLHKRWNFLAYCYCFFGVLASLGVGNATQINTVIEGLESVASTFGEHISLTWRVIVGFILAFLLVFLLLGGAKRVGEATELLIPFVSIGYIMLCILVLFINAKRIPAAFEAIFLGAFSPGAVTGGVVGSMLTTLRVGTSRGVFTNEAGMGTAGIAHASSNVSNPVQQGLMGIVEVFIDTIIICTLTALVIICSGILIPYGTDPGVLLTADAFAVSCGQWIRIPLAVALCLFAIATILGWGLYGVRCAQFLFGDSAMKCFLFLQGAAVICGAVMQSQTVWLVADIVNGLMAIPNLIALYLLIPELIRIIKENA